jgi:hypothetical protein
MICGASNIKFPINRIDDFVDKFALHFQSPYDDWRWAETTNFCIKLSRQKKESPKLGALQCLTT